MNREVEKGRALDEPESLQVVSSLIKQRRDSIEQFQRGGRQDLADRESAEIELLQSYLPPPLDQAAIERRRRRCDRRGGRRVSERHGPRDEDRDVETRGCSRGRPHGQRDRPQQARMTTAVSGARM